MATIDTLVVNLVARHKRFVDGVTRAQKSLLGITSTASMLIGPMVGLAGGFTAVGTASYTMSRGMQRALGFQQALANSTAIMPGITDTMQTRMEEAAMKMANATKFGAKEGAEAFYFLASAGLDAQQSIAALPQVAKFAQAGNFDLALATGLATDAQSALGLTVKDSAKNLENLTRVTDVLIKANTLANASAEQFSISVTNGVGTALRMANKDIEEGVAVLAAWADQGTKGEEAGTSFGIIMRDLETKARENADAFKAAGIEVFNASGGWNNLADVIQDLEERLASLSAREKAEVLAGLGFADRSRKFIQSLVGTSDKIREYEKQLRLAGGTTERVASKQLAPMTQATAKLSSGFDKLATSLFTPALDGMATELTKVGDAMFMAQVSGKQFSDFLSVVSGNSFRITTSVRGMALEIGAFVTGVEVAWVRVQRLINDVSITQQEQAIGFNEFMRDTFGASSFDFESAAVKLKESVARSKDLSRFEENALSGSYFQDQLSQSIDRTTSSIEQQRSAFNQMLQDQEDARQQFIAQQELEERQTKFEQLKKSLEDSLMTPLERFYDELGGIHDLMNANMISADTFNRAILDAQKRLDESKTTLSALESPGSNAAVRVGSEAAFNAQDRYRNATALQQQQNKAFKQRDQTNKELKAINRSIKDSGKAQYAYVSLV